MARDPDRIATGEREPTRATAEELWHRTPHRGAPSRSRADRTQRTSIPPADVDSTFESVEHSRATGGFRAAHRHEEYAVRREYHPDAGAGGLEVRSEYYADGTLVRSNTRCLIEADGRSPQSGAEASIAEFCRADHYAFPEGDIETAIEAADRYSRVNEACPAT